MIPPSKYPTVFFGRYIIPNGVKPYDIYVRHPIEWLVLDRDEEKGRVLLLSKHILDWEGFADCPLIGSRFETSWDSSFLRSWLNGEFYENCFSAAEQEMIIPVFIAANRDNGKRTIDKVFLLSDDEVKKYFDGAASAVALEPMVDWAGSGTNQEDPVVIECDREIWWTRTTGSEKYLLVCVDCEGNLCEYDSNSDEIGVRPAMWVKL